MNGGLLLEKTQIRISDFNRGCDFLVRERRRL